MKVAVLGLGNVLMRDDAFGPYVVRTLEARYAFPEEVTLQDLGTPGLDLHPFITGQDALIIVDTVKSDGLAGEIRTYRRDEILKHPPGLRVSPHDPGIKEALLSLEFAATGPGEVFLVGVIPGTVEAGVGLSPAVQGAVEGVMSEVVGELERLGRAGRPIDPPREPDLWWEETGAPS
jgi:hydrogenase maturation protease